MMRIRYMIGAKCNFHCAYCILTKGTKNFIETEDDSILYEAINECKKHNKPIDRILITGGEPTLYRERVISILKSLPDVREIMIHTNLTNVKTIIEFLKFKNVRISLSWDGEISDRDYSILDNLKLLINHVQYNKLCINYVVTPTSYTHILENMNILENIQKGLSTIVEHSLVQASKDVYDQFNIERLEQELRGLYTMLPGSSIFMKKHKNCYHISENDYIEIQNGKIYYGCCEGIAFYDIVTDKDRFFYCKEPDICMTCKNEYCNACGLKFDKLSGGMKRNEHNFFCIYYGIIKRICEEYKNYHEFIHNHYRNDLTYEINLSWDCNLSCKYCFENKHKYRMSYDTIDKILYLIELNINSNPITVDFFGGEPLMLENLDRVEYIVDRLIEMKSTPHVKINFTTNCTYYNDRIRQLISKIINNNIELFIQVSIDGDKNTHNINRCNSFDVVMTNLNNLKNDFGSNVFIQSNTVLSVTKLNNLLEIVKFINQLKRTKLLDSVSFRYEYSNLKDVDINWNNIKLQFITIIEAYKTKIIDKNIFQELVQFTNNINFDINGCGMCLNMLTFDPYGNIIPCHRLPNVYLANINNLKSFDLYQAKLKNYTQKCEFTGSEDKSCELCAYNHMCVICKAANIEINNDMCKMPDYLCNLVHMIGDLLLSSQVDFQVDLINTRKQISKLVDIKPLYDEYMRLKNSGLLTEQEEKQILLELNNLM